MHSAIDQCADNVRNGGKHPRLEEQRSDLVQFPSDEPAEHRSQQHADGMPHRHCHQHQQTKDRLNGITSDRIVTKLPDKAEGCPEDRADHRQNLSPSVLKRLIQPTAQGQQCQRKKQNTCRIHKKSHPNTFWLGCDLWKHFIPLHPAVFCLFRWKASDALHRVRRPAYCKARRPFPRCRAEMHTAAAPPKRRPKPPRRR